MLPFSTTTVTIGRLASAVDVDPSDTPRALSTVASGVRAVITVPGDQTSLIASLNTTSNASLYVDPGTDIVAEDQITDEMTGDVWMLLNTTTVYALIPHVQGALRLKTAVT
jgi:hypothetical protein